MIFTPPTVVPEHLIFRSADGSLALAGIWMIVVGSFVILASLGNVFARGPWAPRLMEQFPRLPRFAFVAWGIVGLIVGASFIAWPFLASPGHLY
jgi:hypothetical protein